MDRAFLRAEKAHGTIFFLLACFLFANNSLSCQFAHGTTIVIIGKRDTIFVGADSKGALESDLSKSFHASLPIDKIRVTGNACFAIAGMYFRQGTNYNAFNIAESCFVGNGDIFTKTERLRQAIRPPLVAAWTHVIASSQRTDLSDFGVTFYSFGFYRDTAFVLVTSCEPKITPTATRGIRQSYIITVQMDTAAIACLALHDSVYFSGALSDSVTREYLSSVEDLILADAAEAIRQIIQRAIDLDPVYNGSPIRILTITRMGIKWIQ